MSITEKDVHAALDPVVSNVSLSQWEKQRIVQVAMASGRSEKRRRPVIFRRALAVAAAAAFCLTTSVAVVASPSMSDKLSQINRQTMRYLSPTNVYSVSSGISMEVLASMQDDTTVISYLAFTDDSGVNRLHDTVELCDILVDGQPTVITGEPMQQEDGSVVVRVQGMRDPMQAASGKVSISLNTILSGGKVQEYTDTGVTAGDIQRWNPRPTLSGTKPVQSSSCEISNGKLKALMDQGTVQCIKAYGSYVDERVPFLTINNAGIIDDALHVLARRNPEQWYNTCSLALFDTNGQKIQEDVAELSVGEALPDQNISSSCDTELVEYVMALPPDADLDALSLYYTTSTYEHCIKGDWNVTFTVPDEKQPTVRAHSNQDMAGWTLRSVVVTPFGVEANGSGVLLGDSEMPEICLYLRDGTVVENFSSSITSVQPGMNGEPDQISCKYYFDEPLDICELDKITAQGETIWSKRTDWRS